MYRLNNGFAGGNFAVNVVGCGGTGGFVAESLCRLLPANSILALIDPDRVEEGNLTRQNFYQTELGRFKSEALAQRLARRYGRPVAYGTYPVALTDITLPGLVIGCVDTGPARREIAEKVTQSLYSPYRKPSWWVDAGNGESYGQVIIGNYEGAVFDKDKETADALPLPTTQRPELLAQAPPRERGCVQIAEQGPTINQAMAALVIEVVRQLIEGSCAWMQLYLDLKVGTLHPVPATPDIVERITGRKFKAGRR